MPVLGFLSKVVDIIIFPEIRPSRKLAIFLVLFSCAYIASSTYLGYYYDLVTLLFDRVTSGYSLIKTTVVWAVWLIRSIWNIAGNFMTSF